MVLGSDFAEVVVAGLHSLPDGSTGFPDGSTGFCPAKKPKGNDSPENKSSSVGAISGLPQLPFFLG